MKNWRPDRWKNPYHKTEKALGTEVKFNEYPEFEVFEAGADALLTSLLDCGIISISQLEALNKNGNRQNNPK